MLNFFKKLFVRFMTRKVLLIRNTTTGEYFVLSHVSDDGYVVLLTGFKTYLPVFYKAYKERFEPVYDLIDIGDEKLIVSVNYDVIYLQTGESVRLCDINETGLEDSIDLSF